MNRILLLCLLLLSSGLTGCGGSLLGVFGASIETNQTVAKPPSDVKVYVTVEDSGDPVGYLSASNFQIYENDVLLDSHEIGLRLLSRNSVAAGYTVVLLDLSGAPKETELKRISRGAAHFVEKISTTQPVTVVAFDGSDRAREIARFSRVETSTKRPLPDLRPFLSQDQSRDLHSALLSAIKGLGTALASQEGEAKYGTIVTLVRGPDLAGRKTEKEVRSAISDSEYEFYSISPEGAKFALLGTLGKDGSVTYPSIDTLPMRFQDLGMRVRAAWQSHYLLSYCSPARAGVRKLKVKVTYDSEAGERRSASSKSEFDATGFQAGCTISDDPASAVAPASAQTPVGEEPTDSTDDASSKAPQVPRTGETDDGVVAPPPTGKYE